MLYFPYEKNQKPAGFPHWLLILRSAQNMKESGICRLAGRPSAQHRRFLSASHARRAGTRERSSRYHRYLLRSPIRKNRPLRLSLLRISAGISPLFFRPHFLVEEHRCFRFPFRFTAGRDASFFRFSLSSVETHRFLTICRKILFLNKKKSTEFLQWTMLIIILYL